MDFSPICLKIQELLIKDERVTLPGTGELLIECSPATFLQDKKTIVPPNKKLVFVCAENLNGTSQDMESAGENSAGEEEILSELSGRIRESIAENGRFEVPGLGLFTQGNDGKIEFIADPEFDFAPDNFSLEAISLERVEPKPQPQPATQPKAEHKQATPPNEEKKRKQQKWMMWTAVVVIFIIVMVLFAVLFKEDVIQILQKILYTKEELEIMQEWAAR